MFSNKKNQSFACPTAENIFLNVNLCYNIREEKFSAQER